MQLSSRYFVLRTLHVLIPHMLNSISLTRLLHAHLLCHSLETLGASSNLQSHSPCLFPVSELLSFVA